MDGKYKADFINSVAAGTVKPCPICQTSNAIDAVVCVVCGVAIGNQTLTPPQNASTESARASQVSSVAVRKATVAQAALDAQKTLAARKDTPQSKSAFVQIESEDNSQSSQNTAVVRDSSNQSESAFVPIGSEIVSKSSQSAAVDSNNPLQTESGFDAIKNETNPVPSQNPQNAAQSAFAPVEDETKPASPQTAPVAAQSAFAPVEDETKPVSSQTAPVAAQSSFAPVESEENPTSLEDVPKTPESAFVSIQSENNPVSPPNVSVVSGNAFVTTESGSSLAVSEETFTSVVETDINAPENEIAATTEVYSADNLAENKFANGLPEWSIEPPQILVRRKK